MRPINTSRVIYKQTSYDLLTRHYERLNMFGYNYYGGVNNAYRSYLQKANTNLNNAENNKRLQDDYVKNASRIKNGYDISGRVLAGDDKLEIPGVSIQIKGSDIGTVTNSAGYFKIRVPISGKRWCFLLSGTKPKKYQP